MVFWKSLFTTTADRDSTIDTQLPTAVPVQITGISPPPSTKIFLSTDPNLDLYELEELCDAVGWSRRPLRKVKKALQHSFIVVSMWEVRGATKRLIGFSRATSDRSFNATIWDVMIHPDFQGKSLGKALMKYTIDKIRAEDISNVTLFADGHVVSFYSRMGFVEDPEGIKGMFWYPD
jgi:ribosomal protein S18 acetylase RimI-like enzyme